MGKIFVAHPYVAIPIKGYRGVFEQLEDEVENLQFLFADNHVAEKGLLDNITRWIKDSELIVVDITGLNPNVLIEFGIARALQPRRTCLIVRGEPDLPTDLKGLQTYRYDTKADLYRKVWNCMCELADYEDKATASDTDLKRDIMELFKRNTQLGRAEVGNALGIDHWKASKLLGSLVNEGRLEADGEKRGRHYRRPRD